MTITVNIHEAKTHLSRLIQRVLDGEDVIIANAGEPVALLSAYSSSMARRTPGQDAGKEIILPEFDEPLLEFAER